jgi:Ser/Thr protein kinase RdoA (MazF antagonist)
MATVSAHVFDTLTPARVLDLVEASFPVRGSGICRPRASYINRVYELGLDSGEFLIAKFYRPGRWSMTALRDELEFVSELAAEELPVVPPLPGRDGQQLQVAEGMPFAVFPRCGGRPLEELEAGDWQQLGRLLARMHLVGACHLPSDRVRIGPEATLAAQQQYLMDGGFIPPRFRAEFGRVVDHLRQLITPLFATVHSQRIHGDCHRGNILHRPGGAFHLIDFDDMAVGPTMQDIWMLLPGHPRECQNELDALAEGYETFRSFDWGALRLVEPLRAMRYVHYAAWCGRQQADQGFVQTVAGWGTERYWQQEIEQLQRQCEEIEHEQAPGDGGRW